MGFCSQNLCSISVSFSVYFLDVGSSRKYMMIMNYAAGLNDNLKSRPTCLEVPVRAGEKKYPVKKRRRRKR
jgi:hypothetical protein